MPAVTTLVLNAFSGEAETRCNSFNESISSAVASGMKVEVNICR
tara:strand:- start:1789 stop:1920 length:132 start_codon:yes stop_codon:yes gene_type:complete